MGGKIHWTQCQDFQRARQPHSQSSQNCDRCSAPLHWVSLDLTDPTAPIPGILHYVPWFLSLSCRDQSCTDILEIYNKVKAEDLSSTDEEEEVRSFPSLLKFGTWKKFWFLLSLYFMDNCTEFWRWGCLGSPETITPWSKNAFWNWLSLIFSQYMMFCWKDEWWGELGSGAVSQSEGQQLSIVNEAAKLISLCNSVSFPISWSLEWNVR